MSVIVKGMKMPENCIKCRMLFDGWCYVSPPDIDERVAPTVEEAWEQGKPEWCPLEEYTKDICKSPVAAKKARCEIGNEYHDFYCPNCGGFLAYEPSGMRFKEENRIERCHQCGQLIQWREEK